MKKIKALLISLAATLGLLIPTMTPAVVGAVDVNDDLCRGAQIGTDGEDCGDIDGNAEDEVTNIANVVINIFSLIVGIVSVIMIIVAGLRYIVSGGAAQQVTNARNTILYAVVGLIIVVFAQTIVRYVISKLTE